MEVPTGLIVGLIVGLAVIPIAAATVGPGNWRDWCEDERFRRRLADFEAPPP